ncbi:MAG: hypothetical protein H6660_08010 [Ardenticatenaceae bacterium]|nr:hypothetical protein [Ardenticatenaceae bacterium]
MVDVAWGTAVTVTVGIIHRRQRSWGRCRWRSALFRDIVSAKQARQQQRQRHKHKRSQRQPGQPFGTGAAICHASNLAATHHNGCDIVARFMGNGRFDQTFCRCQC